MKNYRFRKLIRHLRENKKNGKPDFRRDSNSVKDGKESKKNKVLPQNEHNSGGE